MQPGFLANGRKGKRKPRTRIVDVQQPEESGPPPSAIVASTPSSSSMPTTSLVVLPAAPVFMRPPRLAGDHKGIFAKMAADPNFRLRFFTPPDNSFVFAYWPDIKHRLLARPDAFTPLSSPARLPFEIRAVPGKGMGMVAKEAIAPGALIVRERPLLVMPATVPVVYEATLNGMSYMPEDVRSTYLTLANCLPKLSQMSGILNTNGTLLDDMPGQLDDYCGVFRNIARVNHSCRPNARPRWDADLFAGELRAQRAIAAGEEITFSYTSTFLPSAERQDILSHKYHFTCKCILCSLPPALLAANDQVRTYLGDTVLPSVMFGPLAQRGMKEFLDLERMLEMGADDSPTLWRPLARELTRRYCAEGKRAMAVKWARKAMEMTLVATGTDGGWAAVVEAPEKTDAWRSPGGGT
ncbi:SET domain-containing protein [Auriscalpium vulgare]|uniref:SET domain-containing protein n=1 Tax=Auriscalpium vulgare TaxID=40419 RepID=A0ACB8S1U4_9AGAM|nr:SET domain-containing protein [Auriscalpium vulgare]